MKFKGTHDMPSLDFFEDEGRLIIAGRSTAVRAKADFWEPLIEKMEEYLLEPRDITLTIHLEFFATSSAKALLQLLNLLQEKVIIDNKRKLLIKWIYDDEDMLEAGEDYSQMVNKPEWKFIEEE